MAKLNAKRILHREPNTQSMEVSEDHCNTETGQTQRYRRATEDLPAVNYRPFIQKLYDFTGDIPLCKVIQNMLSSRRFYVELNNNRSR